MKIELKTGILEVDSNSILDKLVSYGSRINKKRGFLFVSKVLGKHLPTDPKVMEQNYQNMANLIKDKLGDFTLVIGFAETATALGFGVFEALNLKNSIYLHTTRYLTDREQLLVFQEEHSHAPSHILYKPNIDLSKIRDIVLVDDEVTTGKTAINIVKELKKIFPKVNFYLISMLNWNQKKDKNLQFFSLYQGNFNFISKDFQIQSKIISESKNQKNLSQIIPYNFGRYGISKVKFDFSNLVNLKDLQNNKILVIGTGEFMFPPYKLALYLKENKINVFYQATTRSPINIDGVITSSISFKDNYFENIDNFIYNIESYDLILICYETNELPKKFNLKEKLIKSKLKVKEIFFNEKIICRL